MTIEFNTIQILLLISIMFLLMASTLTALGFILENKKSWLAKWNEQLDILDLINRLKKITLLLALVLFMLTFILYARK